jgi:2-hydroxyglutarate dehydrogenase
MVEPPERCEVAIIGGGILGLAVARELQRRGREVCVLEREALLAAHQTGHNSGVVHAGIYYEPGSLKARLCVSGAAELRELCLARGLPFERCGKLIVATAASELGRLDELERRGRANGVPGLRRLDGAAIAELEPHAVGVAALHSPHTAIVDFAAVARILAAELADGGAIVATGCEVRGAEAVAGRLRLEHARGVTEAGHAVFCAGAWADRLAVAAGADRDPRIVPFRGAYLRLRPQLVRGLIYPVPDPRLPFLGVHLTRTIGGELLLGPTALLALARDAGGRVRRVDLGATLGWPGSWRLFARFWRQGFEELHHAVRPRSLLAAAARFVPELEGADAEPAFAGVRAQALGRDGRLVDDFAFSRTERALHVRNAPSPGATSALAIARHVADEAERAFA